MRQIPASLATLAVLLAATTSGSTVTLWRQVAFAQSPAQSPIPVPTSVPDGTTVRINSSNSMAAISQALKQKFESQFSGTKVELNQGNTDNALQAVQTGQADLAAIGRPLTAAEKAAGLQQTPVARRKIAVVVGSQNPFPGDMTGEQFSQIFRGEITNWSQIGGANKPIRFIDRATSDTRQALQPYPVFQKAPFKAGATAVSVNDDSTDAVINQLGDDGISYAVVDQVTNKPGVKIVSLYGTLPNQASYPFSQPFTYVYKQPANPAVQAFLGYAAAPASQQAIAAASAGITADTGSKGGLGGLLDIFKPKPESPSPAPSAVPSAVAPSPTAPAPSAPAPSAVPSTVAQAPAETDDGRSGIPGWLWLLSIPVLGGLIFALLRGSERPAAPIEPERATPAVIPPVTPPVAAAPLPVLDETNSRIILTPRNSHAAYAYWEVSEALKQQVRDQEGGETLAVRLYDVTGQDIERHPPHSIEQFGCSESDQDLHVPIPRSDRDYLVELGYVTQQNRWRMLARSMAVHVPGESATGFSSSTNAVLPVLPTIPAIGSNLGATQFKSGGVPLVDPRPAESNSSAEPLLERESDANPAPVAGLGAVEAAEATGQRNRVRRSQIVLVPRNSQDAYAYWEVLDHHKDIAKQHGGQSFILRICDVTGVDLDHQAPHSIQQFNCEDTDTDRHVTVPDSGEYVAEIGYLAKNGRWLRIARSAPVNIPAVDSRSTSTLPFS